MFRHPKRPELDDHSLRLCATPTSFNKQSSIQSLCRLYTYVSHTHTLQEGHLYARTLQQKSPAFSCNANTSWKILRIETLSSSFSSSSPRWTPSLQGLGFRVMLGMSLNVLKANTQAGRTRRFSHALLRNQIRVNDSKPEAFVRTFFRYLSQT